MNKWQSDIINLHKAFDHPVNKTPVQLSDERKNLRILLIEEEIQETLEAIKKNDLVSISDGIADSIVVLLGVAIECGIDMNPIWKEVHKTNMTKSTGPIREDGKRLKPEGWEPPKIKEILIKQGMKTDEVQDNN